MTDTSHPIHPDHAAAVAAFVALGDAVGLLDDCAREFREYGSAQYEARLEDAQEAVVNAAVAYVETIRKERPLREGDRVRTKLNPISSALGTCGKPLNGWVLVVWDGKGRMPENWNVDNLVRVGND